MSEVPTRLDAWRREQPFGWDFHTWTTANGGYVMQLAGWRVYYTRCIGCRVLVTTRRDVRRFKKGQSLTGRWPLYCTPCHGARRAEHNAKAKDRMRRKRAEQKTHRETQFAKRGMRPPSPGRPRGS